MNKIDDEFSLCEFLADNLRLEITRSDESHSVYVSLKLRREYLYGHQWEEISGEWITIPDPSEHRS